MKFKFCGSLECPEWLLSEIVLVAKLSAIKVKILVINIIKNLLNDTQNNKKINQILSDTTFKKIESQNLVSVLEFILKNSIKFEVDEKILCKELEQLGLPSENASSIAKSYKVKYFFKKEK